MADEHTHEHEHDEHDHDEHDHDHDHDEHGHDQHGHDQHGDDENELDPEARKELEEAQAEAIRRRALSQIRQYPDVALRMKAREIDDFDEELVQLVERMQLLMEDAQGVGLAATQLGMLRRVFVFAPDDSGVKAVVNPVLLDPSDEKETDEEGCLSLREVRVPVERSVRVTLVGKDPTGEDVRYELDGLGARVVQHEVDHLDGVLIIDRTDDENRKQARGALRPQPVLR
jgi:peptide deformylase